MAYRAANSYSIGHILSLEPVQQKFSSLQHVFSLVYLFLMKSSLPKFFWNSPSTLFSFQNADDPSCKSSSIVRFSLRPTWPQVMSMVYHYWVLYGHHDWEKQCSSKRGARNRPNVMRLPQRRHFGPSNLRHDLGWQGATKETTFQSWIMPRPRYHDYSNRTISDPFCASDRMMIFVLILGDVKIIKKWKKSFRFSSSVLF